MARRKQVLCWCVLALLLAGWLYIAWNIPYTHDDWDWGLPEGLERWLSGALNNRYAGTFFVLAMTRSQLVKTAVMGGCMFLISLLLGRLAGRGQPDRAFSVTVVTSSTTSGVELLPAALELASAWLELPELLGAEEEEPPLFPQAARESAIVKASARDRVFFIVRTSKSCGKVGDNPFLLSHFSTLM